MTTAHKRVLLAAWGSYLLYAAVYALAAVSAQAQNTQWERLPLVGLETHLQVVNGVNFLQGEGDDSQDPSLDSLLILNGNGDLFVYNPSGSDGAAGDNGSWHPWHVLCNQSFCGEADVLVTESNAVFLVSRARTLSRSVDRGRTWARSVLPYNATPIHESALPGLAGPAGERGIVTVVGDGGETRISRADGAPGTWTPGGSANGLVEVIGEVPPSAALPSGRLLMGLWNGVVGSTDGGASYQPTSLYQQGGYIVKSTFAFVPVEGHPYGGVAFAGVDHAALASGDDPRAEVHRSDDGGQTWTLVRRFTAEETGLPPRPGDDGPVYPFGGIQLIATPGGMLWASVHYEQGPSAPGVILRSDDLGATWSRADDGFTGYEGTASGTFPPSTPEQPFGWRVKRFALSRTGVLYAATDRGVWRTTQPVVSGEAWPTPESTGLSLSVSPNPSRGLVTLSLSARETERTRVVVTDVTGREVAAVEAWATPEGSSVSVDASSWASGVYVARASVGRHTEHVTARFTVAR